MHASVGVYAQVDILGSKREAVEGGLRMVPGGLCVGMLAPSEEVCPC